MKRLLLLSWIAGLLLGPVAARADTLHLTNGGKVTGTVARITVRTGPLSTTFSRAQVRSVRARKHGIELIDAENTRYLGKLESVAIRHASGVLTFDGRSVKSIDLVREPEPDAAPEPIEGEPAPAPANEPDEREPTDLSAEQRKAIRARLAGAAALRDEYLKRAEKLAKAKYETERRRLLGKWQKVKRAIDERRGAALRRVEEGADRGKAETREVGPGRRIAVARSGAPSDDAADLERAEKKLQKLSKEVQAVREHVGRRLLARRERIRAYHAAIARYLATGREIDEKAIRRIFEKALTSGK